MMMIGISMLGQSKSSAPQKLQRELKMTCGTCTKTGFAPNCDFPVRASQGQPFAAISPPKSRTSGTTTRNHRGTSSGLPGQPKARLPVSQQFHHYFSAGRCRFAMVNASFHTQSIGLQQVHLHQKAALIFHWVEIMHVVTLLH